MCVYSTTTHSISLKKDFHSIQNNLSLTLSGLDSYDTGNRQSKETQPHTFPPHC